MSQPLDGIRILDFTHVQSGPTCTQLLAWMGADVIKVERPGVGDATRNQLVDVEGADSLYFTMLNHNKRSLTLNTKNEIFIRTKGCTIAQCEILLNKITLQGKIPEPLRVSQLLAKTILKKNLL